jgi:hypothetical protein
MRQDSAESLEIGAAIGACILDQALELERRVRQRGVLEEQPRGRRRRLDACLGMRRHPGRIEIEIHDARQNAWFVPFVILVASRHKCELSRHVPQLRSGQPLDERVAIASQTLVAYGKKVQRTAKAELHPFTPRGLHDLGGHTVPRHRAALHDIGWLDLHAVMGLVRHGSVEETIRCHRCARRGH